MLEDLLWKHIDHTTSQSLVTDPTDSLLSHSDMPRPREPRIDAFAYQQLCLHLGILRLLQVGRDPRPVKSRIGGAHPTFKVEFKFFDREGFWNQVQGGIGWEAGSMFGKDFERRIILGFISMGRGEVQR